MMRSGVGDPLESMEYVQTTIDLLVVFFIEESWWKLLCVEDFIIYYKLNFSEALEFI